MGGNGGHESADLEFAFDRKITTDGIEKERAKLVNRVV